MLLYDAFLFIKYKYLKKHRYLDPYLQDLVASKTEEKTDIETKNEFNLFTFKYEGLTYELLEDKLKLINE